MNKKYGINVISTASGVRPHTIRTWEKRYQVFSPQRSEGGQRIYCADDLVKAKLIVTLIEQGHTISSLADHSLNDLRSLVIVQKNNVSESDKLLTSIGTKNLLNNLTDFNIDSVASEMQHLRLSMGVKEFIFKIVLPVMRETEKLVIKGKYSVTQEHIISTIVRNQLGQINLANGGPNSERYAIATPEGNLHELPILISDIICHANRVSTCYLGAAHPAECLSEAVNSLKCRTIVMGVVSSDQWNYKQEIISFLKLMDKNLKDKLTVVLGGGTKVQFPIFNNIVNVKVVQSFLEFDKMLTNKNEYNL